MSITATKAAVRYRDGHACTKCGMTVDQHRARYERNLEVHRLIPNSAYTLEGCVTLCKACHRKQHRRPPRDTVVIRVRMSGALGHALRLYSQAEHRTISNQMMVALKQHLTELGYWPRPATEPDA